MKIKQPQLPQLLLDHAARYPMAQCADFLKLLYQNEFGPGHLLDDPAQSLQRLCAEAESLPPDPPGAASGTAEPIGNGLCRLHLRALREGTLHIRTFHRFFELSAACLRGTKEGFLRKAAQLEALCGEGALPFPAAQVRQEVSQWLRDGAQPMRHSQSFRRQYAPAYRVVQARFCEFLPLFCRIDALLREKPRVIAAIDGNCAAGKSTLAALLQQVYGCTVVPADHFFLRPQQRTPERLREPGGNIDYERLREEALLPLRKGDAFSYRPYDCAQMSLSDPIPIEPSPLAVVEGSYSLHPTLFDAYDLRVFLHVEPDEQLRRIRQRNGDKKAERFQTEWIPMENRYFSAFSIRERSDLVFP